MSSNTEKLLNDLQNKATDRKAITLYLSETLYKDFRKFCKGAPVAPLIEQLMRDFLQTSKDAKKGVKKR